jgi:hypothetical protein
LAHGKAWMVRQKRCWPACSDCWTAYKRWQKRSVYLRDSGQRDTLVDPEKSMQYVREMIDIAGRRRSWIAEQLGISTKTVSELYVGRRYNGVRMTGVFPFTEKKLADLHASVMVLYRGEESPRCSHWIPARLTMLALQGMRAQGWDSTWIQNEVGQARRHLDEIALGNQKYVTVSTEEKILKLARSVGSRTGPSNRTATIAKKHGWVPTLYHDELV